MGAYSRNRMQGVRKALDLTFSFRIPPGRQDGFSLSTSGGLVTADAGRKAPTNLWMALPLCSRGAWSKRFAVCNFPD